jgi:hypothetical protein
MSGPRDAASPGRGRTHLEVLADAGKKVNVRDSPERRLTQRCVKGVRDRSETSACPTRAPTSSLRLGNLRRLEPAQLLPIRKFWEPIARRRAKSTRGRRSLGRARPTALR